MINPKKDRFIYSDILTPPYVYELEKAITTTYSLDIAALISCMIPLAFSSDVNNRLFKNKVSNLTALRNLSEKLVVFCDPGQIKKINIKNKEFALLLENMIVPVNLSPSANGDYPAFHPKMWLLQFVNKEGSHKYRFIILSRNISYDKCYDVSFVLENSDNHLKTRKTNPIIDFLSFMNNEIDLKKYPALQGQHTIVNKMISDLMEEKVCFSLQNERYEDDDFDIYPLFNSEYRKKIIKQLFETKDVPEKEKLDDMFVMSPFVSSEILNDLHLCAKNSMKPKFFTRKQALDGLSTDYNSVFDFYAMSDAAVLGEDFSSDDLDEKNISEEEEQVSDDLRDIHAKLFLTQKGKHSDLYIGSANATNSAFRRNIELMIRIGTQKKYLNVEDFVKELIPDENSLFEKIQIKETQKVESAIEKEAEGLLKRLCHLDANAIVTKESERYCVKVNIKNIPTISNNFTVMLSPFSISTDMPLTNDINFSDLPVTALSDFYLIKLGYQKEGESGELERIIKIPTEGIPYDERNSAIVNQLITDKDTFAEYVTLLLSKDPCSTQIELMDLRESNAKWKVSNTQTPLYEMLLQASVNNPSAIRSLSEEMKLIKNDEVISPEFRQMYGQFLKVIGERS